MDGKVVSVTTDGFLTNIPNLEEKLSDNFLCKEYSKLRYILSGDSKILELKHQGKGIIS